MNLATTTFKSFETIILQNSENDALNNMTRKNLSIEKPKTKLKFEDIFLPTKLQIFLFRLN